VAKKNTPHSAPAAPETVDDAWSLALRWLAPLLIVAAGWFAYANGFDGKFLFDDHTDIDGNAAIRQLWPPWDVVLNQGQSGVSGRPLVALSYALNYAYDPQRPGEQLGAWRDRVVPSWHATNLAIHILAALALFGVVRRALLAPRLAERYRRSASSIACATALLWVAHPLTTPSVQYLGERVESMMGMFFLVAFYCALRGFADEHPGRWYRLSVASTALSACCKEVAVALPILVLVFDALFVAQSWKRAWSERRGLYIGLFATWVLIALLVLTAQGRSQSVGFDYQDVGVVGYVKTQAWAVVRYLRLSLWPSPLIFDYGKRPITAVAQWLPHGLFLLALLAATALGIVKRKPLAFLGAWWFVILAPTSSVLPIVTELIVEHRAYLPLAGVVFAVVLAGHALLERAIAAEHVRVWAGGGATLALGTALVLATRARMPDYRSEIGMWADVVAKLPSNDRAHGSYANDLREAGRIEEAGLHYEEASRLAPDDPYWLANLGTFYLDRGRLDEAIAKLELSRGLLPTYGMTLSNLGFAYMRKGQNDLAIEALQGALAHDAPNPGYTAKYLGELLAQAGRRDEAITAYRTAIMYMSQDSDLYVALARVLLRTGAKDPKAEAQTAAALMQRLLAMTSASNLVALDILATAQAQQGLNADAAATARRIAAVHRSLGRATDAEQAEQRAKRYESAGH
jgi:tetratricopeptide (TPR) repeat protein